VQIWSLLAGVELFLFLFLVRKIQEMRRLEKELQRLAYDLALALLLASRGHFVQAEQAAQRWRERMNAFKLDKRWRPPPPPLPPSFLH
jgi:hypothetical protein